MAWSRGIVLLGARYYLNNLEIATLKRHDHTRALLTFLTVFIAVPNFVSRFHGQVTGNSGAPNKPQSIDELLLFQPSRFPEGDWLPKNLQFQDLYFVAEDYRRTDRRSPSIPIESGQLS
jgi:hypothetical protein